MIEKRICTLTGIICKWIEMTFVWFKITLDGITWKLQALRVFNVPSSSPVHLGLFCLFCFYSMKKQAVTVYLETLFSICLGPNVWELLRWKSYQVPTAYRVKQDGPLLKFSLKKTNLSGIKMSLLFPFLFPFSVKCLCLGQE